MSNVPLGGGGTSPHANLRQAEADYERLQHCLRLLAETTSKAFMLAFACPLSVATLEAILNANNACYECNRQAGELYRSILKNMGIDFEESRPQTPAEQPSLFANDQNYGRYQEGR